MPVSRNTNWFKKKKKSQFSAAFSTVLHLDLELYLDPDDYDFLDPVGYFPPPDHAYDVEWLHLLRQFPAMQMLHISTALAEPIFFVLEDITAELVAEVLPSLGLICIEGMPASSLETIVDSRRFSDHPITVVEATAEFNKRLESYASR